MKALLKICVALSTMLFLTNCQEREVGKFHYKNFKHNLEIHAGDTIELDLDRDKQLDIRISAYFDSSFFPGCLTPIIDPLHSSIFVCPGYEHSSALDPILITEDVLYVDKFAYNKRCGESILAGRLKAK